ncbi:MAG: response regulator, partial [Proteobacteria bacterium]|nr:response regulator [Pseudomonadota bacterium]
MKPQILIVEDETALVELVRYNLEAADYAVAVAADGEEALRAIAEGRPDLVILDWMLPLVSGLEVCRQLRRKPETRSLPVIMLTARGEETDRIRGLETGADDYITKPFSPNELVARVRALLRRSRPETVTEVLSHGGVIM